MKKHRNRRTPAACLLLACFVSASIGLGAETGGMLEGRVVEEETGEPVGFTYLLIDEQHFWQRTNADGTFRFADLPPGRHVLKTYRIGYRESVLDIRIRKDEAVRVVIELRPDPVFIRGAAISSHRASADPALAGPDIVVADRKLRQNLGMTIAKTIEKEPGLDWVSMGPAPARPVLRGLGGDRLLLLEDGERTGDLSATSADHAVSMDPITSSRIEVIRGPEAMLYGSNVLGGVVNVIRDAVPRLRAGKASGSAVYQGETVNSGHAGGLEFRAPFGPWTCGGDFSMRSASDIKTPAGTLPNTSVKTANGTLGAGLSAGFGYVGAAGGVYSSDYGIPPDPKGGHPSGVNISVLRQHARWESQIELASPALRHLFVKHQYSRYGHRETEADGTVGVKFGVVTHHVSAVLHFCECGFLRNARIGLWSEFRDYASGGLTFTPGAAEWSGALFIYNEWNLGKWAFNAALRPEGKTVDPDRKGFATPAGMVRNRRFAGLAGAVSGHRHIGSDFTAGFTLSRTFRAPGIEELFSEGPHLAAYSYEVGNSDLGGETGLGVEGFAEYETEGGGIRAAAFRYALDRYIFPANTGQRSWRRADLYLYRYAGMDATLLGFECAGILRILSRLMLSGKVQALSGELADTGEPLPRLPPAAADLEIRYQAGPFSAGVLSRTAASQKRPGEFESPTAAYAVQDVFLDYYMVRGAVLYTFSLTVENAGNREYRRHLNRVRDIMPEPGRNIRFLTKVYF